MEKVVNKEKFSMEMAGYKARSWKQKLMRTEDPHIEEDNQQDGRKNSECPDEKRKETQEEKIYSKAKILTAGNLIAYPSFAKKKKKRHDYYNYYNMLYNMLHFSMF